MIKYSKSDLEALDRITRLTLVNSLTGYMVQPPKIRTKLQMVIKTMA